MKPCGPSLVQALRAGARVVPADTTHGARKSNKYCTAGIRVFADTSLSLLLSRGLLGPFVLPILMYLLYLLYSFLLFMLIFIIFDCLSYFKYLFKYIILYVVF
jgi:hypothetical protein